MRAPTALVVGHVTLDRAAGGAMPGGTAYYAAQTLAALGAAVRVLTAAGRDFPADALRARVAPSTTATSIPNTTSTSSSTATPTTSPNTTTTPNTTPTPNTSAPPTPTPPPGSIDALVLPSPASTTFENVYSERGRRTQRVLAAAPPLDPAALPASWREADLLLLAPVLGELDPAAFAAAVRARSVGLCVQGLVREARRDGAVVPRRLEIGPTTLAGIGLAVLGEDDLAGQRELLAALVATVPLVTLTRGARGCEVHGGGRARRVGVHPAHEVDPTGAGDAFAAAMLLALARGDAPVEAARLGAAAASIVVEGRGGEALPRVGEAWARMLRIPVEEG